MRAGRFFFDLSLNDREAGGKHPSKCILQQGGKLATFAKFPMHMMTREEILAIDQYCREHKMSYRKRLDELEIPFWQFYKAKRKYRLEDEGAEGAGEFVQMVPGMFSSGMMPVRNGKRNAQAGGTSNQESFLTVELRTSTGTAMRIQGSMTAEHLRAILSGNV